MRDPLLQAAEGPLELPIDEIGESFACFRVMSPPVQHRLEQSIRKYGQLAPVVVLTAAAAPYELIDGFKRLRVVRAIGVKTLSALRVTLGPRAAKAAVVQVNQAAGRVSDFEEALVLLSLARDDGLTQVEIAGLFGRDQSWVSRRIALAERLCDEAREQLRLGLLTMASGRELVGMPRGIQPKVLDSLQRHSMTSREVGRLVTKLLSTPEREWDEILRHPHEVLDPTPRVAAVPADALLSPAALSERLTRLAAHCQAVRKDLGKIEGSLGDDSELAEAGEHAARVISRLLPDIRRVATTVRPRETSHA